MDHRDTSRAAALAWVALAYLLALLAALFIHGRLSGQPAPVAIGAADLVATLVVFGFSMAFDNSSFYDPYWSVTPPLIALALICCHAAPEVPLSRQVPVIGVVTIWGVRLTWNWVRGWQGLGHEDFRYVDLREKTGRAYPLVSLFGLHLMPTVTVFLVCLPLLPVLARYNEAHPLRVLDSLALSVAAGGVALETVADEQLRAFRRAGSPGGILASGVWAYCRHPNYLGELGFWWGIYLLGLVADPGWWWTIVGPGWLTCLFVFFSVPLMDRRSLARRPGYAEHMARVPALVPRLRAPCRSSP